jgi:putative transposase
MKFESDKPRRRSLRLPGYDYAQAGAYFVTICTQNRECLFGQIIDRGMQVNPYGMVVQSCWDDLPKHYRHVELDVFVIMPNHVHGIILLTNPKTATDVGAGLKPAPTQVGKHHALSEIIRAFKTFSSQRINQLRGLPGTPLWQRNYYEHVIRGEKELHNLRQYIANNPLQWALDRDNPAFL